MLSYTLLHFIIHNTHPDVVIWNHGDKKSNTQTHKKKCKEPLSIIRQSRNNMRNPSISSPYSCFSYYRGGGCTYLLYLPMFTTPARIPQAYLPAFDEQRPRNMAHNLPTTSINRWAFQVSVCGSCFEQYRRRTGQKHEKNKVWGDIWGYYWSSFGDTWRYLGEICQRWFECLLVAI